jgi:hypothetical protein
MMILYKIYHHYYHSTMVMFYLLLVFDFDIYLKIFYFMIVPLLIMLSTQNRHLWMMEFLIAFFYLIFNFILLPTIHITTLIISFILCTLFFFYTLLFHFHYFHSSFIFYSTFNIFIISFNFLFYSQKKNNFNKHTI